MKISELKEWINKLPEEVMDAVIVIRDLKEVEENKFGHKDEPIASIFVDTQNNRLAFMNIESAKTVDKIRASAPSQEAKDETTETE
jgi:hypothetical protein